LTSNASHLAFPCGVSGIVPMLAAPMPGDNDFILAEAVNVAAKRGLVKPNDHVVCLVAVRDDLVLKVRANVSFHIKCVAGVDVYDTVAAWRVFDVDLWHARVQHLWHPASHTRKRFRSWSLFG
jgi:hypothetical protein